MISVSQARAIVLANAAPCECENVELRTALGRTLRQDVRSFRAQPPFRASAMDGYALRAIDTPGVLQIIGEAGAGRALSGQLRDGQCARIFTGAPLPAGADSVLIQEDAVRDGELVTAPAVELGRHVRSAGVDFAAGEVLLRAGAVLDAPAIALAAAAGKPSLVVSRKPRVAILSGGNELVAPGLQPGDDQIFDSMGVGIAALAEQWGAHATRVGPLADDAREIAEGITATMSGHDLTIVVGGASVGDHDHARPAVRDLGGELFFEKVALRPGKPTWLARVGRHLILGLPGNPASAFVCARLFLRPLLDQMCGRDSAASIRTVKARTRTPLSANGARETYMRAALETDETGQTWALAPARQDSSLLSVFAGAQALILRTADAAEAPAGAIVDVLAS